MAKNMRAFIGLGANMANPDQQIERAINAVSLLPASNVTAVSSWYETAAIGNTDQAHFTNAALALDTHLCAITLLQALLSIETQLGRIRTEHWGPRSIDIDLLIYADEQWCTHELWLPHPRICERKFVLQPLHDIQPTLHINGQPIRHHLALCTDQVIRKITPAISLPTIRE